MKISDLADQVRGIPLRDVLQHCGFEVRPEGTTLRAKDAHHNIVVTGSRWFDNKAGVGGVGAIDLVIHLAKVDFPAACRSLAEEFLPLGAGRGALSFPRSGQESLHPEKKSFEELAALYAVREDSNWPIARAYLVEKRKIRSPRVDELHGRGSIYANDHRPNPSLVFLHCDQHGKVRGATLRDTKHQSTFRPCLGNKLTAWFAVGDLPRADRVVAVESPIDALSYHSLFGCRSESLAVVSCAGATVPRELMLRAYEGRKAFVLALDSDPAGERGRQKAQEETLNWSGFKLFSDRSKRKDWNDDLIAIAERLDPAKRRAIASLRL
jgi:Toprim-like